MRGSPTRRCPDLDKVQTARRDEAESFRLHAFRLETPCELFLSDEKLGEASEARQIEDGELGQLLDATVSIRHADRSKRKLTQMQFLHNGESVDFVSRDGLAHL